MRHQCTRPPLRRLRAIISHLKKGHYPNCTRLARELEVERRTVLRDIEYLRDSLEVPVEYDPHHYGYHLNGQFPELPTPAINQAELLALILAERALPEFVSTPFEQSLHSAIRKPAESLEDSITFAPDDRLISFRDTQPTAPNLLLFQTISEALNQRREIKFSYRKPQTKKAERRHVRPYHLACIQRQWYLFAHDLTRKAIRRFHLSRICSVQLTETTFTRPKNFSLTKLLSGSFGLHSATGQYDIRIRFTGLAAALVQERTWHPTQKITPLPDGKIDLTLKLTSLEEIERWILSWGAEAEVLEPIELRKQIVTKAREIVSFHQKAA